jgi:hypothetical protein
MNARSEDNGMSNHLELPLSPQAGEVFLYLDLDKLGKMPVAQAIAIAQELGYSPELRYRQQSGIITIYALLKYEQHDPNEWLGDDYLGDEMDALAEKIPTDAIRSPRRLLRQPLAS